MEKETKDLDISKLENVKYGLLYSRVRKRGMSVDEALRDIKNKLRDLGLNETLSYTLIPNSEVHKFTNEKFTEIILIFITNHRCNFFNDKRIVT